MDRRRGESQRDSSGGQKQRLPQFGCWQEEEANGGMESYSVVFEGLRRNRRNEPETEVEGRQHPLGQHLALPRAVACRDPVLVKKESSMMAVQVVPSEEEKEVQGVVTVLGASCSQLRLHGPDSLQHKAAEETSDRTLNHHKTPFVLPALFSDDDEVTFPNPSSSFAAEDGAGESSSQGSSPKEPLSPAFACLKSPVVPQFGLWENSEGANPVTYSDVFLKIRESHLRGESVKVEDGLAAVPEFGDWGCEQARPEEPTYSGAFEKVRETHEPRRDRPATPRRDPSALHDDLYFPFADPSIPFAPELTASHQPPPSRIRARGPRGLSTLVAESKGCTMLRHAAAEVLFAGKRLLTKK